MSIASDLDNKWFRQAERMYQIWADHLPMHGDSDHRRQQLGRVRRKALSIRRLALTMWRATRDR